MHDKKIRVLMFSNIFGGKNTFIHNELIHLGDEFDIKYIALKEIPNSKLLKKFNNFEIIPLNPVLIVRKIQWWLWKLDLFLSFSYGPFSKKLKERVNKFNPDVVHLQFGYEAIKFLDNAYDPNSKYIIHFHGYGASALFKKKAYVRKLKYYLRKENIHQIYVSDFIKKRFETYGISTKRGQVIRCGIELDKFKQKKQSNLKEKRPLILSQISSQVEKKGIPYTIEGFYLFKKEYPNIDIKLYISGTPSDENRIKIQDFGIQNSIVFTGLINHDEVLELLNKTDVFIHPSITSKNGDEEGIPTAIMEAMAIGIPIISTLHSGIPELVKDGIHGVLVKERDSQALKSALYSMIQNDVIGINMKSYLIDNNYDLDSHLYHIKSLYKRLAR